MARLKNPTAGPQPNGIGTLKERSLHSALKEWYSQPGDGFEVPCDGFVIDLVRGETLIEIQTRNFAALKRKLTKLTQQHPVRLVHPIAREKWIVRQTAAGEIVSRRKSPKRGRPVDVFRELVHLPHLLGRRNFTLEVLLTQEEEVLRDDGAGSWRRRRWSVHDRRLLDVTDSVLFESPADYAGLIPPGLPEPFTNRELAEALKCRLALAQKMTYTLSRCDALETAGKRGQAILYRRAG